MHAFTFVRDNLKVAGWMAGIAAIVLLIVLSGNRIHSYRVNKAAGALYAAQTMAAGSAEQQKALEEMADDYSSTPAGREAMLLLGDIYMARGDIDLAQEKFGELAKKSGGTPLMQIAALHRLAAAQKAAGRTQDAAKTFITAADNLKNLNRPESLYQAGLCYEELKQYDEAAKIYRRVTDSASEGDARSKSEERLLWLIASGTISG